MDQHAEICWYDHLYNNRLLFPWLNARVDTMFHMFPVVIYLPVKQAKFALVVGIVMIVSGRASSSF